KQKEVKKKSSGLKDIKNIDAQEEVKPKKNKAKNVKKLNFEAALESADTVFDESKRRKKHLESQTKDKPEVEKSKKSSKVESGKHDLQDDLPNKAEKSNRLSKGAYVKVKKDSKVETNTIEKTMKEDTEKSKSKISETVLVLENEKRDEEEEPEKEEILNEIKQMKTSARASKNEQKNPEDVVENIYFTLSKRKKTISQQQIALMASSDLELLLEIWRFGVEIVTNTGSGSPKRSLDRKDKKPFTESISIPLLTEVPEDAASNLPNEIIQKDKSKLPVKEEYLLSTMSTQMCSSLSEPPPDMFDF
ncbi:PREDICTED: uncharacterized protein LOC108559987, partial [Nicrophorus vespilloides]|uniref:Uncharacterized protein LOC108559987 n=1 Tax=Nicrophorus vespilloides TaxID=110193 RepID=A0ABM1ME82_NICVS